MNTPLENTKESDYGICFGIEHGIITAFVVTEDLLHDSSVFHDNKVGMIWRKSFTSIDEATEELGQNFVYDRLCIITQ